LLRSKAINAGVDAAALPNVPQPFERNGRWFVTFQGRVLHAAET
jgi:hypothetical protein